jgi:hypothetical protein
MSDVFFSKQADVQLQELITELYKRLGDNRRLLAMYDEDPQLSYTDRGYAQGVREEIGYLERLLDRVERS